MWRPRKDTGDKIEVEGTREFLKREIGKQFWYQESGWMGGRFSEGFLWSTELLFDIQKISH